MISVEPYLTFAEFNGGHRSTMEDFCNELARYSREDILRFCIATNIVIYGIDPNPSRTAQAQIVHHACLPETLPPNVSAALSSRPLFHRQQLLFVAKESLLVCSSAGLPLGPGKDLTRLFLKSDDQNPDPPLAPGTSQDETLRLLTAFIPIVEANRFSPSSTNLPGLL